MNWAWQLDNGSDKPMPGKSHYQNQDALIKEVKTELQKDLAKNKNQPPRVLVIGALGRCGKGALDLCRTVGIPESSLIKWDMAETKKGGPFEEIRESDVRIDQGPHFYCSLLKLEDLHQLHLFGSRDTEVCHRGLPSTRKEKAERCVRCQL